MQIIKELEPSGRGLYAGAVGYLDFAGNLDFCIAIRTVIMSKGKAYVQAGAGIVMDSNPAAEYEETRDKAQGAAASARNSRRQDSEHLIDMVLRHRQLRFVHLQPRAVSGRARAPTCRSCATTPSTLEDVARGEAGADRHLAGTGTARAGGRDDGA